jgi:hypothetical protein
MSERELRIAHTEALFRDVNERIVESAKRVDSDVADFVCECSDPACVDRVQTTISEYEHARADATRFLLVPGHEDPEVERVVKRPSRRLAIVKKVNEIVARRVRRLDPRAENAGQYRRGQKR